MPRAGHIATCFVSLANHVTVCHVLLCGSTRVAYISLHTDLPVADLQTCVVLPDCPHVVVAGGVCSARPHPRLHLPV